MLRLPPLPKLPPLPFDAKLDSVTLPFPPGPLPTLFSLTFQLGISEGKK